MGVPAFFKWLSMKYPKIVVDAMEEQATGLIAAPASIDRVTTASGLGMTLFLDMNGIIHPHRIRRIASETGTTCTSPSLTISASLPPCGRRPLHSVGNAPAPR